MEPHRKLRVVPSNAPSLSESTSRHQLLTPEESEDALSSHICPNFNHGFECKSCCRLHVCHICKRPDHGGGECKAGILQVSSGNTSANMFAPRHVNSKLEDYQGYDFEAESFTVNGALQSIPPTLRWEQHTRHRRVPDRQPNYWHVEFNTPRYRAYREKCRQKGSKEEAKWPDHVEEAFQMALRVYRRRGRKKEPLHGKQSGGNEWISDYIYKTTRERRCRKQVSSHIQVLKGFLHENLEWMSLVVDIKPERSRKKQRTGAPQESAAGNWESNDSDDALNYQISHAMHRAYSGNLLQPAQIPGSNEHPGPTIRSVKFSFALFKGPEVVLHTFTSLQSEMGSAPKALDEISEWRTMFPHLATYHEYGDTQTPIFLFEANLSLMHRLPSGGSTSTQHLGTELDLDFTQGLGYTEWCCLTRFYENKGHEINLENYQERSQLRGSLYNKLKCSPDFGNGDMRLEDIPLKSKWWAELFSDFIAHTQDAEAKAKKSGNPQYVKDAEEHNRRYLCEFSVMQELRAVPRGNSAKPQRMAIVLWKFNQTRRSEAATTSWRRIITPLSPFQVQSPVSGLMRPHMTLDSAVEDARVQPPILVASDYYNPLHPQPSIFMDNTGSLLAASLSEESSPDTAQSHGYHSFPSTSTTTSFPSSVSNSIYPPHPSQEHSYQSQDPGYAVFGSFDSQSSTYEVAAHGQESQDSIYHSQDSTYHHVGTPLYEECPSQNSEVPNTSHDFTGGEIQLDYEVPLIAPGASMVPQPQLIQHLEQFDHHDPPEQYHDELTEDQQSFPGHFQHNIDLNLLATQFNAWEDHLHTYPEMERQIGKDAVDGARQIQVLYSENDGQALLEGDSTVVRQGQVLGEVDDGEE